MTKIYLFTFFIFFLFFIKLNAFNINNYGQWRNLSSTSKNIYVSGMIDTYLSKKCESCDYLIFDELGVCLNDLFIGSLNVVYLIDEYYSDENNWDNSPQDYFASQIIDGYCIRYKESFLEKQNKTE